MKVILLQDVKGTGKKGDLVDCKDGFAQNFLLKKGLAKTATAQAINDLNFKKQAQDYHDAELKKENHELCLKVNGLTVNVTAKHGENGKFFGSITSKEIADKLAELGYDIDKKKILLYNPIKETGSYSLNVRISAEETAKITVIID